MGQQASEHHQQEGQHIEEISQVVAVQPGPQGFRPVSAGDNQDEEAACSRFNGTRLVRRGFVREQEHSHTQGQRSGIDPLARHARSSASLGRRRPFRGEEAGEDGTQEESESCQPGDHALAQPHLRPLALPSGQCEHGEHARRLPRLGRVWRCFTSAIAAPSSYACVCAPTPGSPATATATDSRTSTGAYSFAEERLTATAHTERHAPPNSAQERAVDACVSVPSVSGATSPSYPRWPPHTARHGKKRVLVLSASRESPALA